MQYRPLVFLVAVSITLYAWQSGISFSSARISKSGDRNCTKWIVLTTINYPTDTVKRLASFDSWCTVVVGDLKTPNDWAWPNVEFLSTTKQARLGYSILKYLPFNHYSRKNVGYLYAIQHGAVLVYETDDDNYPSIRALDNMLPESYLRYDITERLVNPYAHFGQPSVWPRGYPLENISNVVLSREFRVIAPAAVGVLQGLANGDPDVDAIFRLTRKPMTTRLNITFDSQAPSVALPLGTMAPFNSQNTIFFAPALWATLIPITTTFRVCDIWRGYWAQRLMWETGLLLAFTAPSVIQNRNVHDYFDDYLDERDLYELAGKLCAGLSALRLLSDSFQGRAIELAKWMADHGFWADNEVALIRAWLSDLSAIGYSFPSVRNAVAREVGPSASFFPKQRASSHLAISSEDCGAHERAASCLPFRVQAEAATNSPHPAEKRPFSSHKCISDLGRLLPEQSFWQVPRGGNAERSCVFRNVCLRLLTPPGLVGELVYFRETANRSEWLPIGITTQGEMLVDFPADFRLVLFGSTTFGADPSSPDPFRDNIHWPTVGVTSEVAAPPQQALWLEHRVGLMADMWTFSLGHYFFDVLIPLFRAQLEHGLAPTMNFQLLSLYSQTYAARGDTLDKKFGSFFADHPMEQISELLRRKGFSSSSLVCFREAVVGIPDGFGFSRKLPLVVPAFREWMMTNSGLDACQLPQEHLILFFNKSTNGTAGRGIRNHKEINEAFTLEFNSKFRMVTFEKMSAKEQMALFAAATVCITPGSGGSFSSVFLPPGAVRIELQVWDQATNQSIPFGWESNVWTQLKVFSWSMPVAREEHTPPTEEGFRPGSAHNPSWFTQDYTLNVNRLIVLTRKALRQAEQAMPHLRRL